MSYSEEPTQPLLDLAGGDHLAVVRALNSAAQEIDEAFAEAGYTTPLDFTQITDTESRLRLESRVADAEQAIAARLLSSAFAPGARKAVSSKVSKDWEQAEKWLNRVRKSGVPNIGLASGNRFGVGVVGTEVWDTTPYYDIMAIPDLWD